MIFDLVSAIRRAFPDRAGIDGCASSPATMPDTLPEVIEVDAPIHIIRCGFRTDRSFMQHSLSLATEDIEDGLRPAHQERHNC